MSTGAVAELVVFCAIVMAPAAWVSWIFWKTSGREDMLRRITRRCEIHDRPTPVHIRQLEADLDMGPAPSSGDLARAGYANPALIACGHTWCQARSGK